MFNARVNATCNNMAFSSATLRRMENDVHATMARLYEAAATLPTPITQQSELARALIESPQTINNWESPKRGISKGGAAKAQELLGISSTWVLKGRGPMLVSSPGKEEPWRDVLAYSQGVGLGAGTEPQEYAETHALKFRASSLQRKRLNPEKLAVFYGQGDSMLPRIKKGDAILFDTSDATPVDGAIFIVEWRGEVYAKRCEILDGVAWWRSDNPSGDHTWNKARRGDDPKNPVAVLGRVRWLGSWED